MMAAFRSLNGAERANIGSNHDGRRARGQIAGIGG
jgi:hypothetical protein